MTKAESNLLALLRAAVGGRPAPPIASAEFGAVFLLAQKHSVENLLYYATKRMDLPEWNPMLRRITLGAATREAVWETETRRVFAALEEAGVWAIPLKGYFIKHCYPAPEMRYMSDVDLLFDASMAQKARQAMERCGYRAERFDAGTTDYYRNELGLPFELHRELAEEGRFTGAEEFLRHLPEFAQPYGDYRFLRRLSPEVHYTYILCHAAKHFAFAGIGLRAVLDLFLIRRTCQLDEKKLRRLLKDNGLLRFAERMEQLSRVWFGEEPDDPALAALGDYILGSGTFGKEENKVADRVWRQKENKVGYILRRMFPPRAAMCSAYPVLNRRKWLLPICWLRRAGSAMTGQRDKTRRELRYLREQNADSAKARERLMRFVGL